MRKGMIMKMRTLSRPIQGIILMSLIAVLARCSDHEILGTFHGEVGVALAPQSITGNGLSKAGPTTAVSGGTNTLGVLIPTTTGIVARIENGLEKNAVSTKGSFAKSLAQVRTNLPKTADVTSAAGFDQVELLAYSACADLTTGSTPLMQSVYNVQTAGTIASNQAALVAAGVRMLDQHAAGLASQGPASAQVTTILTNLVQTEAAVGTNTSIMAFMVVCIAANTAGTAMLGL